MNVPATNSRASRAPRAHTLAERSAGSLGRGLRRLVILCAPVAAALGATVAHADSHAGAPLDPDASMRIEAGPHLIRFSRTGATPVEWILRLPRSDARPGDLRDVRLLDVEVGDGRPRLFDVELGTTDDRDAGADGRAPFDVERVTTGPTTGLRFTSPPLPGGLRLVKSYLLADDGSRMRFVLELRNEGESDAPAGRGESGPAIVLGPALGNAASGTSRSTHVVGIRSDGVTTLEMDEEAPAATLPGAEFEWGGLEDRYLLLAIRPTGDTPGFTRLSAALLAPSDTASTDGDAWPIRALLHLPPATIAPSSAIRFEYDVFAGPKTRAALAHDPALAGVRFADLWNWMRWLSLGLAWLLGALHGWIGNWGVTLVALALVIRILLAPITIKAQLHQARVMLDQARLKPLLAKINEEHRDDVERRHEATRQLYDEHGVSMLAPMMGCVWVVLQIPIFIGLYFVIGASFELSGASFLWIDDLAQPDGLLSWGVDLPLLGPRLNALPILMAISQIAASGAGTAAGADPAQVASQRKAMIVMSIVFLVLLYRFPAGLMLYWLMSNVLQSGQQLLVRALATKPAST